jgi:hypothetical protein
VRPLSNSHAYYRMWDLWENIEIIGAQISFSESHYM